MKKPFAISTLSIAVALSCQTAVAEQPEEVFVTATKTPQALSTLISTAHIIDANMIAQLQPRDLPSLLGRVSGLSYRDSGGRGSVSGVFVRGATPGQSIVLVDGVRVASATTGSAVLNSIPVSAIDRVEIVKGPLSGVYGADAVGGVIQIFTKQGKHNDLSASLNAGVGSNSTQKTGLSVYGGGQRFNARAGVQFEETAGIDNTTIESDGNDDLDGFEDFSGTLSASLDLSNQLQLSLHALSSSSNNEFDNTFGADTGYSSESDIRQSTVSLSYRPQDHMTFTTDAGYFYDHLVTPAFGSDIKTIRQSVSTQANFDITNEWLWSVGADFYQDNISSTPLWGGANYAETDRNNRGAFVQAQYTGSEFGFVSSARYDDNSTYGTHTNYSAGFSVELSQRLTFISSFGTAFRAPTFNELYYPGYGTETLLPEESETIEVSFKHRGDEVNTRLTAYKSHIDNLIGTDYATFSAGNTSRATLEGIELELSTVVNQWQFSGYVDYLEARDANTDAYLDDRAVVSSHITAGRSFNKLYLSSSFGAEHGRRDRNGEKLGGFGLVDIFATYQYSSTIKFFGRINNLLDKEYTLNLASATAEYETERRNGELSVEFTF